MFIRLAPEVKIRIIFDLCIKYRLFVHCNLQSKFGHKYESVKKEFVECYYRPLNNIEPFELLH